MEDANFLYGRDACCKVAGKIIRKGKFKAKFKILSRLHGSNVSGGENI